MMQAPVEHGHRTRGQGREPAQVRRPEIGAIDLFGLTAEGHKVVAFRRVAQTVAVERLQHLSPSGKPVGIRGRPGDELDSDAVANAVRGQVEGEEGDMGQAGDGIPLQRRDEPIA